ncbi:hypothetical protein [Streptobacillus notomytis]|uniref:hypothetical protein n=1 Tax=Streptobacillus notomytis TaxID=1712031 RepID=UPI0009375780|nr:hypothetical protein [Streptobacillus notomytis]
MNATGKKFGGRVKGTPNKSNGVLKDKRFLGYKYTELEYNEMKRILEKYKKENKCTTSKAIMDMILSFK